MVHNYCTQRSIVTYIKHVTQVYLERKMTSRLSSSEYNGIHLLLQLIAIALHIYTSEGLEKSEVKAIVNENCTRYINSQHEYWNHSVNYDGNNSQYAVKSRFSESKCPLWHWREEDGTCKIGVDFNEIIIFERNTNQPWLLMFYCMTTSDKNDTNRSDVIGSCLLSFDVHLVSTMYYPLPCNISKLNEYTCAGLNREGQLCGRCKKGFAPPVYSYVLNCVNCTDYHLNWLKYIGVAFGPLTLFCVLICFFHISATSAYLHGFIFFSQILTMQIIVGMLSNTNGYKEAKFSTRTSVNLYVSLLGIWNLDMFRVFYKPFCIHPNMTVVQSLALDYTIALYPLTLLMIIYGLVSLHSQNIRIIVTLWRPFKTFLRTFFRNLNIETSLVESFATLYLLSTMKMQSVILGLLSPTALYHVDGSIDEKLYLFLAGDVEYFGTEHMPYAVLALFFSTFFLVLPGLLLFLYPCRFFQHLLNMIHCNFLALRIFMDVFQGHYKDGTNNTRDYRFFSGIFFWTRFILVACFVLLSSLYSFLAFSIIITMLGFTVTALHPHRSKLHYRLDCISLILLSVVLFSNMGYFLSPHNSISAEVSRLVLFVALGLPLLYIAFVTCYWIVGKKRYPQRLLHYLLQKSEESQRLLVFTH